MRIEVKQLCVSRGGKPVLHDVSFVAEAGSSVAVVGPNGAGKTSLMMGILRLATVTGGDVSLDGQSIRQLSPRRLARRIAYVPQIYEGFLGFRVRDIIETGRYAHLDPLQPMTSGDHAAIEAAIDRCDVRDLLDRTADTLSGGERQKVWLAAAVAQESPALLLDEPTNALDPRHQAELIRLMRDLAAAGKTLVIVCHDLNLPAMLGARIVAIKAGRVVFDGPNEAFLEPGRLREVFNTNFTQVRDPESGRNLVSLQA